MVCVMSGNDMFGGGVVEHTKWGGCAKPRSEC
jgi:hypothetical protein